MFDFQKLEVYQKSKQYHISCKKLLSDYALDGFVRDQLGRASFSIPLNIAEGSGVYLRVCLRHIPERHRATVFDIKVLMIYRLS